MQYLTVRSISSQTHFGSDMSRGIHSHIRLGFGTLPKWSFQNAKETHHPIIVSRAIKLIRREKARTVRYPVLHPTRISVKKEKGCQDRNERSARKRRCVKLFRVVLTCLALAFVVAACNTMCMANAHHQIGGCMNQSLECRAFSRYCRFNPTLL